VVSIREGILFPPTLLKNVIVVVGLQDYFQMGEGSFSLNALMFALEELKWGVLYVCRDGVHHVREGILFAPALLKCLNCFFVQKFMYGLQLNWSWVAS